MDCKEAFEEYKIIKLRGSSDTPVQKDEYKSFIDQAKKDLEKILKDNDINASYFMVKEYSENAISYKKYNKYLIQANVLLFLSKETCIEKVFYLLGNSQDRRPKVKYEFDRHECINSAEQLDIFINQSTESLNNDSKYGKDYLLSARYGIFPLNLISPYLKKRGIEKGIIVNKETPNVNHVEKKISKLDKVSNDVEEINNKLDRIQEIISNSTKI